jgi:ABC-type bacteriocin transporter
MMRWNKRIRAVRQHDASDCGVACLHAIGEYFGFKMPIARIRQITGTDQIGTSFRGLIAGARAMGLTAKGVRATRDGLRNAPKPAIAHVHMNNGFAHYVVVLEATAESVRVMDPFDGMIKQQTYDEMHWTGALLLIAPGDDFQPGTSSMSVPRRFWQLLSPHTTVLSQALVGAMLYTILGLGTAVYVQKLVDYVLADGNARLLNLMSIVMIVVLLAQAYIGTLKNFLVMRTGQRLDAELVLGYYKHLLRLPQQFFDTMRVGEIISRVNDAVKIRSFINDVALDLTVNVLVVACSLALMFVYSWKLALLTLVLIPMYAVIYVAANTMNRRNLRQIMETSAGMQAQLVESVNAMATFKRFGLDRFANGRMEISFVRLLRTVYRSGKTTILASGGVDLVSRLATICLLWLGGGLVLDRTITPGELMSCYALVGYLTGPIASLIGMNRTMQDALIAADRLFEILDLEREADAGRIALASRPGDVRLEQVTFRYGSRQPVFERLDVTFRAGQFTAVVGESGSGKSTLAALIQAMYPIEGGRIHIGDYDIRHVSLESLRRVVAIVPQQIDLLNGSVLENIAIGEYMPNMERVVAICRELGILEFIEALPGGFEGAVGEQGVSLSGGQRQRIAIARALYREPEILILDEATSALDATSEQFVQRAMRTMREQGKTVIVIAHRLSTVMQADRIVVLDRGRLAQEGAHADLLAAEGPYRRLWTAQFPGLEGMEGLLLPPPPRNTAKSANGNGHTNGNGNSNGNGRAHAFAHSE